MGALLILKTDCYLPDTRLLIQAGRDAAAGLSVPVWAAVYRLIDYLRLLFSYLQEFFAAKISEFGENIAVPGPLCAQWDSIGFHKRLRIELGANSATLLSVAGLQY